MERSRPCPALLLVGKQPIKTEEFGRRAGRRRSAQPAPLCLNTKRSKFVAVALTFPQEGIWICEYTSHTCGRWCRA